MATLSHSESRRLYSWWWDSHISPKNSKWLQDNLTDMDAKVKSMIKLIEEDADSFARRAEMYYKKRPELIKLVEEFYRAYRALAERYDYATGELRQAHKTMAKAFPNQVPFEMADESSSGSTNATEPYMLEAPHASRSFFNLDELEKDAFMFSASDRHSVNAIQTSSGDSDVTINKNGSKQHDEMFGSGVVPSNVKSVEGRIQKGLQNEVSKLLNENQELNAKVLSESERAGKAESEVQYLKKALTEMKAVKEVIESQYEQNVEKLSSLKGELISAEKDSRRLNEKVSKAEFEYVSLKEAILKLEAERDAVSVKNMDCLERISNLEDKIVHAQADAKELEERTLKAENETQISNRELARLEAEKEAGLLQYKQCLEKIAYLEKKVFVAEENARHLKQQAEGAETEVAKLKVVLAEVTAQKEATSLQYKACLEKISNLESEISCAQGEISCLKDEILSEATKLRAAEDKCDMLDISNQTLRLEADNLFKKIAMKDKELSEKHGELQKLQACLQDERSRYASVEATLHTLQNMHSESQEDQRKFTLELKNGLQMLKDLNICKHGSEGDIQQIKDENCTLKEQNSSSTTSMKDLQNEILGLARMKERYEEEVQLQLGKCNAFQKDISYLKEEIEYLNGNYQALVKQVEMVGLDPKCFGTSIQELQDENSQLKQMNEKNKDEKEILYKKLVNMVEVLEKNAALQSSLSDVTIALEESQEQAKILEGSCNILDGEKSSLVAEKDALISQLKLITKTMQELFEKNNVLESSLCSANSELESLRQKSKSLEELCQLLGDEKTSLLNERSTLAAQLEIVERRLVNLEKRFTELEGNYTGMKKEKESPHSPPEVSVGEEKHEHDNLKQLTESRLSSIEEQICLLQEESRRSKKDFQDELDRSVISQFEIYILQKFVADMEEKNYLLLTECQKQIEASKLAEELISELENENLEQQGEEELLLVEIEKLRSGLHQVRKALEDNCDSQKVSENDHISVHLILEDIADMKHSLLNYNDAMQQLVLENSVLLALLEQLKLEGLEVETEKNNASKTMSEQYMTMQSERQKLLDMNRKLRSEVSMGKHQTNVLTSEVQSLTMKQASMQSSYLELKEEYSQIIEESRSLRKLFSEMTKKKFRMDEENDAVIQSMITSSNLSTIFSSLRTENAGELKLLLEDVSKLHEFNCELINEVSTLREELGVHEIEKLFLRELVEKLEMDLAEFRDLNCRLKLEILSANDYLSDGEKELFDAEMKLVLMENLNSELHKALDGLKKEYAKSESIRENLEIQIQKMSEDNMKQSNNIRDMLKVKGNLESELTMLSEEVEERKTREEYLNTMLREKQNEFELWDSEAATFCFDLQLSAIRELLFEDKVNELCGVCGSLQNDNTSKTQDIELLKERVRFQAGEINGLKSQLLAYAPAVNSLKENVDSLEHNSLAWAKLVANHQTSKDVELEFHANGKVEVQDLSVPNEILELQNRIKAVEKVVMEEMNRLERQPSSKRHIKLEAAVQDIVDLKQQCRSVQQRTKQKDEQRLQDKSKDKVKFQKTKSEILEVKSGILMKDIQLDQVSDGSIYGRSRRGNSLPADQIRLCWETPDNNHRVDQNLIELQNQGYEPTKEVVHSDLEYSEQQNENLSSELDMEKELGVDKLQVSATTSMPNRGGKKKKILERLASDGQKLANIQTNVQDLKRKLDMNKKSRNTKNVDLDTVKEQLIESEETITQLINVNGQMTRKIEDIPVFKDGQQSMDLQKAASFQKKKVSEQARKESEKIGRLQLEIQKIHYVLLQMEDKKKNKGINRFSRTKTRTTVILRDFIHIGRRSSVRQKKGRLCGCFKPSSTNAGGSM